jgi:hypothetical protein
MPGRRSSGAFEWPVYAAFAVLFVARLIWFAVDGYESGGIGGAVGWIVGVAVFLGLCFMFGRRHRARRAHR